MARIVIAEDEESVLELLRETLLDHDLVTVGDGQAALDAAAAAPPDLFILDINMPVLDGLSACKRIKADPQLARVPVLMLTGAGALGQVESGFEAKADDYIVKPFSPRVVAARVEQLLKRPRT